jgi:hypothetical protein
MSQIIPIYIPTFISDQNYNPSRVLPHLYFYNGLIDCETYWIESGSAAFGGVTYQQNAFPYFDNYNVVSGSFPTTNSESLLFNNENAAYGQIPTENLYTQYWETYVSLLYNPKTRLLNCEAIIPLADYFKMELNDVVNFKGNYYHLRAINEYSLKTGECVLQLLGPIIPDTLNIQYKPTVWYKAVQCFDASEYYTTSYPYQTYDTGSIVTSYVSGSKTALTITEQLENEPSGSLIFVTGSEYQTCPPATNYYRLKQCTNGSFIYSVLYPFGSFELGSIVTTSPLQGSSRTATVYDEIQTVPPFVPLDQYLTLTASVLTTCP